MVEGQGSCDEYRVIQDQSNNLIAVGLREDFWGLRGPELPSTSSLSIIII